MPAQSVVPSLDALGACGEPTSGGGRVWDLDRVAAAHIAFVAGVVAWLVRGRTVVVVVVADGTSC